VVELDWQSRAEAFSDHLERPRGKGRLSGAAHLGTAGGAACGDRLVFAVDLAERSGEVCVKAGFEAVGCGALTAAASAAVALVEGRHFLEAAKVGAAQIEAELGGLSAAKAHAAQLAEEALHRALGKAVWQLSLAPAAERVVVGLSGGVDSAVAAALLAERGQRPVGVTFELWRDEENDQSRSCCSAQAVAIARRLAAALGIPHLTIDLRETFKAKVVDRWAVEHRAGLTPYPCLRCNGAVRFAGLAGLADRLGAPAIATGHYARVVEVDGEPLLALARDRGKDQTYPLAAVEGRLLKRLALPLGDLAKQEVRALAAKRGLAVANRPDSQDLCFLAGTSRERLLRRLIGLAPGEGPILDRQGRVVGSHRGFTAYTIGQRKGLGLGGGGPFFVLAVDAKSNSLVVGRRAELLVERLALGRLSLRLPAEAVDGARIRARGEIHPARLEPGRRPAVRFERPVERTAPGQLACLYSGELVAGWGIIAGERP